MAFRREENVTIAGIEDKEIRFFFPGPSNTEGMTAGELSIQIRKSDNDIYTRKFDLITRLGDDRPGAVYLSNLFLLRDYITLRLNDEVLPLP